MGLIFVGIFLFFGYFLTTGTSVVFKPN